MSEAEINIKKILVPIDGSDASLKAAKYAIKAAKCEKAQIICIHVIPAPENISEFEGKPFYSLQAYYDELGKSAKPWFEKINNKRMMRMHIGRCHKEENNGACYRLECCALHCIQIF